MTTKIFEEANLENYNVTNSSTPSDSGNEKYVTPSESGSEFTKTLTGDLVNTGTPDDVFKAIIQPTSGAFWTHEVTADLKIDEVPIIPTNAEIHKVRISFDYDISCSGIAEVDSGTGTLRVRNDVFGQTIFVKINSSLFELPQADLDPTAAISTCTGGNESISDSEVNSVEHEFDFDPDGITRDDFLSLFNPAIINLAARFQSTAQQCAGGTVTKNTEVHFDLQITNWRMEVDYEEGGGPPSITLTGTLDIEAELESEISPETLTGDLSLEVELVSDIFLNEILGDLSVEVELEADLDDTFGTDLFLEIDFAAIYVLSADPSGIYQLISGLTHDTLYLRDQPEETLDIDIPTPFIKTSLVGG